VIIVSRIRIASMIIVILVVLAGSSDYTSHLPTEAEPPYAKWGSLAMSETKKRYPNAQIIDYLHVGHKEKLPTTREETFKLWLRQGNHEWGVYVRITFETETDRVISIKFDETSR
jgi:hypothetical protein